MRPSRHPAVSIVLPVRNGASCVAAAINSICVQSIPDWELILIDDGSTDGTAIILSDWAARDGRIRVVETGGRGLIAALNLGIAQSRAPFIARMDADDVAWPSRIELQLAGFEQRPGLIALGGQVRRVYEDGTISPPSAYPTGPAACRRHLAISSPFCHPAVMLRASTIAAVGGYREPYQHAEDYDLWLRLSEVGEIDNLADIVLDYHVHKSSVTGRYFHVQAVNSALARVSAVERQRGEPDPTPANGWASTDLSQELQRLGLPEPIRQQAQRHYWRVIMLNGGFLDPDTLPEFRRMMPVLIQKANSNSEREALAYALLRAAAQAKRRKHLGLALHCAALAIAASPVRAGGEILSRGRAGRAAGEAAVPSDGGKRARSSSGMH